MDILQNIKIPTLLLDEAKCKRNIARMAEKCREKGLIFRPHFKTHQSIAIGRWFREQGIQKITASSLRMAEYFAKDGWDDITVAFPVNIREIETINRLAKKITLNLLVESTEAINFLGNNLKAPVQFFIKIDVGTHRTGVNPEDDQQIFTLLGEAKRCELLKFAGFLAHTGHTYSARSKKAIIDRHTHAINLLNELKQKYISNYPKLIISYGDTPSSSVCEQFQPADEIRPGNFVFYDVTQAIIGSCKLEDIAVAMGCPVVALHPERSEIVVYGGGIHFSKDRIEDEGNTSFGWIAKWDGTQWEFPSEKSYVRSLSQEHGIISASGKLMSSTRIGDILIILPIHSCMSADLMKSYMTTKGERIDDFLQYN